MLIEQYSDENAVICDPFMGSGSTGVACNNTNRNFIGIEIDKNYFDIANERIYGKGYNESEIISEIECQLSLI